MYDFVIVHKNGSFWHGKGFWCLKVENAKKYRTWQIASMVCTKLNRVYPIAQYCTLEDLQNKGVK